MPDFCFQEQKLRGEIALRAKKKREEGISLLLIVFTRPYRKHLFLRPGMRWPHTNSTSKNNNNNNNNAASLPSGSAIRVSPSRSGEHFRPGAIFRHAPVASVWPQGPEFARHSARRQAKYTFFWKKVHLSYVACNDMVCWFPPRRVGCGCSSIVVDVVVAWTTVAAGWFGCLYTSMFFPAGNN